MQKNVKPLDTTQIKELVLDAYQSCQAQNMQILRALVAGMTHDFNNVLTGILGTIELAQMKSNPKEKKEMLESAYKQGFHAAEMMKQTILFSRQISPNKELIELNQLLNTLKKITRFILSKDINLDFIISKAPLHIWANISQVQQILFNLIHHAADTLEDMDNAALTVQLHRFEANQAFMQRNPTLSETTFARIDIQNNSKGIAKESIENIFELCLTSNQTGKDTGLGLVVAYAIVQEHGGIIEVESQAEKGSCFSVYLPLIKKDSIT